MPSSFAWSIEIRDLAIANKKYRSTLSSIRPQLRSGGSSIFDASKSRRSVSWQIAAQLQVLAHRNQPASGSALGRQSSRPTKARIAAPFRRHSRRRLRQRRKQRQPPRLQSNSRPRSSSKPYPYTSTAFVLRWRTFHAHNNKQTAV